MAEKRFVRTYKQETLTTKDVVLVDRVTGVNYYFHLDSGTAGLTPLLDRDGKPVVTPRAELDAD